MSGFEVLFTFYGLLLGLAVANVTSGFADLWRRRKKWQIGIAPSLLGLFILLAAAQQWMSFWGARDTLTMGPWQLLTAMGMALPYIFVSQAMFPADDEFVGSFEDYYLRHSRVLQAALLVPPLISFAYNVAFLPAKVGFLDAIADYAMIFGLRAAIPIVLMIWRHRWIHRIGIALYCMLMLLFLFR